MVFPPPLDRFAAIHDRKGHPMSFSVDLCRDFERTGGLSFQTVPASHPSDYDCKPEGVISYLEVGKNDDAIVVRLGKHWVLDELTVNDISDELLGLTDRPDCHRLLLDFSGVLYLSSAMLAVLVRLHRKMVPKGEKLRLCGINLQLRSAFTTTRLDRLFDITVNTADALKAVVPPSPPVAE